jgi:hypothetical protein
VVAATSIDGTFSLKGFDPGGALPFGDVVIKKGTSLSGVLQLDQRIVKIERAIAQREIIVFWSRSDPDEVGQDVTRWNGVVVIPRGGLGAREAPSG